MGCSLLDPDEMVAEYERIMAEHDENTEVPLEGEAAE